jgi:uncharacterized protein YqeY
MSIKETLQADLSNAMRRRDAIVTSTLRQLIAAIRYEEVAGASARVLSDDETLRVLAREAKKRAESTEIYRDAGREDLATQEEAEAAIIAAYMPAELSDAELDALVDQAVASAGAVDIKGMGPVMSVLGPLVAGRASGRRVADRVKARLGPSAAR